MKEYIEVLNYLYDILEDSKKNLYKKYGKFNILLRIFSSLPSREIDSELAIYIKNLESLNFTHNMDTNIDLLGEALFFFNGDLILYSNSIMNFYSNEIL